MRRIAELAETESDSRRFLELSLAEIGRLPWVRGGHWRSPDGEGQFGKLDGHASRFEQRGLELVFHTGFRLSPALLLHMRLLAQVVGQFYEGKRREKAERHNAYLEAVHETGARLTHDVKNLLQSLYALTSMAPRESTDGYATLLQRQLPQLTQRLQSTVEKLRVPEAQVAELPVAAREWCGAVERRLEGSGAAFTCTIEEDRAVPASLFDGFLDNALENVRAKAQAQPGLKVAIAFAASTARLELAVCDSGHAVGAEVVQRLFREPIERESGLGIGLYHVARQARAAGYRLELAANRDGEVCFRLSIEG
jgi:signal transduction histidine kinase